MAKRLDEYNVTARLILISTITIKAESYEDAIARAKELRETDFVSFEGEFDDGDMTIGSVSRNGYWKTKL
jgi:hypothetical protein